MAAIRDAIYRVAEVDRPVTVRQLFYRLVSEGVVEKREAEYKSTVVRLATEMRLDGSLPFEWVADNTRWQRKPRTFTSLDAALRQTALAYRRSLWASLPEYCEVWLEKEALAGVLYEETHTWDVPLMVTRGYSSLTYLHEAAAAIRAHGKPTTLYFFGDHDPSGVDIPRNVESRLREFLPGHDIRFVQAAVTPEQVEAWNLPTRPTKRTDTRARGFAGESVEVDAIPPARLRGLAEECIAQHVDSRTLDMVKRTEEEERAVLKALAATHGNGAG